MNDSDLVARAARKIETGAPESFHGKIDHDLSLRGKPDATIERTPQQLLEEIRHLREALSQMLARETGQDINLLQSPVVDSRRLCAIADNIWFHRPWAA